MLYSTGVYCGVIKSGRIPSHTTTTTCSATPLALELAGQLTAQPIDMQNSKRERFICQENAKNPPRTPEQKCLFAANAVWRLTKSSPRLKSFQLKWVRRLNL